MAKKVKVTVVKREKTIESLPVIGSQGVPVFHFDYVDKDGTFAFNPGRSDFKHKEVLQKIIDFSKLTWNEVLSHSTSSRRNSKHHNLSADKLCKDARERLAKISLDDFIDDLFSFALEGELRIIGLKQGNDFYILWYDAHHEVCPSHKK